MAFRDDDLRRGDTLVQPGGVEATRRLDSVLTVLESARPLKHGARVRFHAGTSEVMARVSLGGRVHDQPEDLFPSALQPGEEAFARVRLEKPVGLTQGDRFVLRAYSPMVTVAGGRVLDPTPGRGRFRSAAGVVRLRRLNIGIDDSPLLLNGIGLCQPQLVVSYRSRHYKLDVRFGC